MSRDYDYIRVYKKYLIGWITKEFVNRNNEDGVEVLHRTRDHYRNLWGFKNVKLVLCWNNEEHIF
jgi:hypothetical protein